MTIERGVDWGRAAPLPAGAPLADSDREVAALLQAARARGTGAPEVGLLGGDLCRTLGGPSRPGADRQVAPEPVRLPVDAVRAMLDGVEHCYSPTSSPDGRGGAGGSWWP